MTYEEADPGSDAVGARPIVLAVDDDEIVAEGLRRLERRADHPFSYRIARSCAEAVEMLQTTQPAIILADYLLQDGYGTDLIALARDIPVVVMTGHGSESVAVLALRAGASDYIMKDDAGGFMGLVGLTLDRAMARRRSEDIERQRASEHAAALRENAALDQFASLVARALSVPLKVVEGYCDRIRDHKATSADNELRSYVISAQSGARRAKSLLEGVREYSRIGRSGQRMQTVDCSELFEDSVRSMKAAVARSKVELSSGDLPKVHGNAASLQSLFRRALQWAVFRSGPIETLAVFRAKSVGSKYVFELELNYQAPRSSGEPNDASFEESDAAPTAPPGVASKRSFEASPEPSRPLPSAWRSRPRGEFGLEFGIMERIVEQHGGDMRIDQRQAGSCSLVFSLPGPRD